MPTTEATFTTDQMDSMQREAHLRRTTDRIRYWRERLDQPLTVNEQEIVFTELRTLETQLRNPLSRRALLIEAMSPHPEAPDTLVERMTKGLRQELEDLRAKLATLMGAKTDANQPVEAAG